VCVAGAAPEAQPAIDAALPPPLLLALSLQAGAGTPRGTSPKPYSPAKPALRGDGAAPASPVGAALVAAGPGEARFCHKFVDF